jgi:PAS domain S-box-containing protein
MSQERSDERQREPREEVLDADSEQTSPDASLLRRVLGDRFVLENLPDVVCVLDRQQKILYLNRAVPGRRAIDRIGSSALDYIPPDGRARYMEEFERAWSSGQPGRIELLTSSGYWWETRLIPVHEEGAVAFMLCTSSDSTERIRAAAALRESESRLRHAVDVVGMGTWTHDWRSDSLVWDEALCVIYGIDRTEAPRSFAQARAYVYPEDVQRIQAALARGRSTGEYEELEHRIVRASGELRYVRVKSSWRFDEHGHAVGTIGAVFDVTDRKRLEEQLYQREKMEAVGELTAGIAHNFNNLLSIILPNVELCKQDAPPPIASQLDDIEHAALRAADLVRQLMLFARREVDARKSVMDPTQTLRRTVEICRTTFDRGIRLELEIGTNVPCVLANAGQLEQVLLNICINARDAFEEAKTPAPSIAVRIDTAPHGAVRIDTAPHGAVRIRVTDNGPGMDEQTRSRVFEPFFTTRAVGRGTGLGLASAYAIVKDHAGRIACQSQLGQGTSFEIELPALPSATLADQSVAVSRVTPGGHETVLIIDDEAPVRRATRAMLEHGGYRVIECGDGEEALVLFAAKHANIDLVVLDRSMPGLSGEQVFFRLQEIASDVPIVLLSGQQGTTTASARAAAALAKPLSVEALLHAVRVVLDRKRA